MPNLRNFVALEYKHLLRMLLFYKSLLLMFMTVVDSKVEWYITSNPVQIGSDLELFCNTTQNPCKNCTAHWKAGRDILAFSDLVIDSSKYAVSHSEEGVTLTIKGLTTDDIHRNYGCSYNFESFTKNLTLPVNFEYQPTKDTTNGSLSLKGKDLHLTYVFEKVHPEPLCSIHLDEEDLLSELTTKTSRRDIFLSARIEMNHTLKEDHSGGNLSLECSVGTITKTYYDVYISVDGKVYIGDDGAFPLWILFAGLILFLVLVIMHVTIYLKRHRNSKAISFDTCMNQYGILSCVKNTSEPTNYKTDTNTSTNEVINDPTTDALISREKEQMTSQKEEPAGEEKVLRKKEELQLLPDWNKEYIDESKPMNNVNCWSVPHDCTRSDSSVLSDSGIDCLA